MENGLLLFLYTNTLTCMRLLSKLRCDKTALGMAHRPMCAFASYMHTSRRFQGNYFTLSVILLRFSLSAFNPSFHNFSDAKNVVAVE